MSTPQFPSVWRHWIVERCPGCGPRSQIVVRDAYGEDTNLHQKLAELRARGATHCNSPLEYTYHHAMKEHPRVVEFWKIQKMKIVPMPRNTNRLNAKAA